MAAIIKCTNVRIFINHIKSQNMYMYIQVVWILLPSSVPSSDLKSVQNYIRRPVTQYLIRRHISSAGCVMTSKAAS